MTAASAAWLVLVVTGLVAVAVDLRLALRQRDASLRTAVVASLAWLLLGLAFTAVVRALLGTAHGADYLTVFLLEKSLSLDNVAVFAVVLSAFAVPANRRQPVLAGGILAALLLRLGFIAGGLAVISAVHSVLIVFGALLVVTGVRMILARGERTEPRTVRWLRHRRINMTVAALAALAVTDLVFAIDSVPAAFAVTHDAYPIVAANVFAVLGLRPLYDLLAAAIARLDRLERALGVLLALIGVALVAEPVWQAPEWLILTAVVVTLGAGVLLSLVPPKRLLVGVGGGVMLVAGAAMLVLPGPGLVVIAGGLALLATEFLWARRLLDRVKARLPERISRSRGAGGKPARREPRTPSAR